LQKDSFSLKIDIEQNKVCDIQSSNNDEYDDDDDDGITKKNNSNNNPILYLFTCSLKNIKVNLKVPVKVAVRSKV
jgi:hypothetical protein